MASRKQRNSKQRRARQPAAPAEPTAADDAAVDQGAASDRRQPPARKGVGARFGAWADRLEETADERPPAPWGNFPLGPLSVLAGLVLIVIGLINANPVQLSIGVGLGMLGGLELSIREHFSGFRSHTTLLAGFLFVVVVGGTFYGAKFILWQSLLLGAVLAIPAFFWLRKKFEKASGGLTYKLR